MDVSFLGTLGISLLLTLVLELAFALIWGVRGIKELAAVALVNAATNPAVVLLYTLAREHTLLPPVLAKAVLELLAIAIEGVLLKSSSHVRRPFIFSLLANLFSFGTGVLINLLM